MEFFNRLTDLDITLIVANPIFGFLGASIGSMILTSDLNNLESEKNNWRSSWAWESINWTLSRALVGLVLGFVIACFAAGELTDSPYSLLKVFGFTLLASSIAPRIWMAQEARFLKYIDKKVDSAIKTNEQRKADT